MISLTRSTFLILVLSSCSSFSAESYNNLSSIIFNNSSSTDNREDDIEFSYIKIKVGNNENLLVLGNIDLNGVEEWVGSNYEKIKTKNGLVIYTSGFGNDFHINNDIPDIFNASIIKNKFHSNFSLRNPSLISSNMEYSFIKESRKKGCHYFKIYKRSLIELKKNYRDQYCYDNNNKILFTKQKINPLEKSIEIRFYYKY